MGWRMFPEGPGAVPRNSARPRGAAAYAKQAAIRIQGAGENWPMGGACESERSAPANGSRRRRRGRRQTKDAAEVCSRR